MLADTLFADTERLLTEQQDSFAYLYAYAAVTLEDIDPDTERRSFSDKSQVVDTCKEILEASTICRHVGRIKHFSSLCLSPDKLCSVVSLLESNTFLSQNLVS